MTKRLRESSVNVFQIKGLAKMIIDFLHPLQFRQWILESDTAGTLFMLCAWNPQCGNDHAVNRHIVAKNNIRALTLVLKYWTHDDWMMLSRDASPEMLRYALERGKNYPSLHLLTLECQHLHVLHDLFPFSQQLQDMLVTDAIAGNSISNLNWLLNTLCWRGVITKKCRVWSDEICQVIEPGFTCGRVSFLNLICVPPQLLVNQKFTEEQRKELFAIPHRGIQYAAMFWTPESKISNCYYFFIEYSLKRIRKRNKTKLTWRDVHVDKPDMRQYCEKALHYLESSSLQGEFDKLLLDGICQFFTVDRNQTLNIFELCCMVGTPLIAKKTWSLADDETKQ